MDSSFLAYLQRLEMMAFFSGYPLVFYLLRIVAGNKPLNNRSSFISILPCAYALLGILYLGLLLKNLYPDYSVENIKLKMQTPFLIIWGLLSILFWIPSLRRQPVLSLLHSLIFFFFILRDILLHLFGLSADNLMVKNDMKIYTISIVLNLTSLALLAIIFFLFSRYKKFFRH
jgi:hypothetical protein